MVRPLDTQKPTGGGLLQRLPRLSLSVWLIIIVVVVLVVAVPMVTTYIDETAKQGPMKDRLARLQTQYADLQKQLSSQGSMTAQINAIKAEVDSTRALYGNACDSIEASQDLSDLAWQYDITITNMAISPVTSKIQGKNYSGNSYVLTMTGQVAGFQNYLIAVGKKFVSSQAVDILIQPATLQGTLDRATLTITIICNQ
jgi:hypothetical protein